MTILSRIFTLLFDGLVAPFGSHRTAALVVLSLVSGAALALLYKATSDQERIKRAREVFKARILEMRLYPDDIVLITRALWGAIASQGTYLRIALKPIVIVLVVALPLFFQLEARFAPAPITPQERFLVTTTLAPGMDVRGGEVSLKASDGLAVDPKPVRALASREIVWRVTAHDHGDQSLTLSAFGSTYRIPVVTTARAGTIGTRRSRSFADALLHPGLPPIPRNSPIAAVHIGYADDDYTVLGHRGGWLAVFLVASLVGAILPAWVFRIQM